MYVVGHLVYTQTSLTRNKYIPLSCLPENCRWHTGEDLRTAHVLRLKEVGCHPGLDLQTTLGSGHASSMKLSGHRPVLVKRIIECEEG